MFPEDELLPLSGLQHLLFCERQCALIHIEQLWQENLFTAEGRLLHEKVDTAKHEKRKGVRTVFGLRIQSLRLGLVGKADVVEYHKKGTIWLPYPVEYKRGKPKINRCDEVQLCAQAICLEEMLKIDIPSGALFYGRTRRRKVVQFDQQLRELVQKTADRFHKLVRSGTTPKAEYSKKCKSCSLYDICLPKSTTGRKSVKRYLSKLFNQP